MYPASKTISNEIAVALISRKVADGGNEQGVLRTSYATLLLLDVLTANEQPGAQVMVLADLQRPSTEV